MMDFYPYPFSSAGSALRSPKIRHTQTPASALTGRVSFDNQILVEAYQDQS